MYSKIRALSVFALLDAEQELYEKEWARLGRRTLPEHIRTCAAALKIKDWLKDVPRIRDNPALRLAYALAIAEMYFKKHPATGGREAADIAEARAARAARNPFRGLSTRERLFRDWEYIKALKDKGFTFKQIAQLLGKSRKYFRHKPHSDTIRKFYKEMLAFEATKALEEKARSF